MCVREHMCEVLQASSDQDRGFVEGLEFLGEPMKAEGERNSLCWF